MFSSVFSLFHTQIEAPLRKGVAACATWSNLLKTQLEAWFDQNRITTLLAYASPTGLSEKRTVIRSILAMLAFCTVIVSAAWALVALFQVILAMLVVSFILTRIFDIRLDMRDMGPFARAE